MEIPNLNNEVTSKNIEAIHLLSEIDVKSVENYASKLLRLHHIKKSQFTAECVICTSPLFKNWQNLVEHLRNPSHIDNIKEDSKQFTAFCIVCKYIVITDDADFIFEHFILHKPKTYKKSCSVNKNLTDKDVFSPVSHNGDKKSSIISSNATTSVKDSTGIHNSLKGGKLVKENHPNSIHLINNTVNIDNYDDGIIDQDKLGVNSIKTSSNRSIPTSSKKLVCSSSIGVLLPLQKDINPNESVKIISSQNSIPESSGKHFDPKKAFFSNTTLQLTSPGVSKDEFNTIGELNAENISDFCTKTYYSSYYRLRKLCYSCLECKALKLTENEFYKHINRIKHYNKFTEFNGIGFIKICDICQVLLLGHMNLIEDHFQCFSHNQNVKCRMGLIKQQYAVKSGRYTFIMKYN